MYSILLAAGIVLLALVGRREHLAFTDSIKDVRQTIDPAEADRIFQMAPASLQRAAVAANAARGDPVDRSKVIVSAIVRDFQTDIFVPASSPITETIVNNFVSTKRQYYQATPQALSSEFYTTAYSNGDAKRLLMTYLGLTPAGSLALGQIPTSSTTVSVPTLLEQMRDNLLEYKMTGRAEYKSVYDGTKAWLDQYIANLTESLTREADAITTDVNAYRSADGELTQTQTDFQTVKAQGPQLEDRYLTIKQQMDQVPGPSSSGSYVKLGIAGGLAIGAIALSLF